MRKPVVGVITTLHHNVGDDFVREGLIYLLEARFGSVSVRPVHKHIPVTCRSWVRYEWDLVRRALNIAGSSWALRLSYLLDLFPTSFGSDAILGSDLVVQSGAPVYWTSEFGHCHQNEWWKPLIERRLLRAQRVPLLNIAAGTCQHYFSDGSEFCQQPAVLEYARRFFDICELTTVRDKLSRVVLGYAGRTAPLLPCCSLYAVDRLQIRPRKGEYIALNFMPLGGHYSWGSTASVSTWDSTFAAFAHRLAQKHRCILVCHSAGEQRAAARLCPSIPTYYSRNYRDYLDIYAGARCGVVNRVHAAFALASVGKPALVVGNDSRARMCEEIGVRSIFVADANVEMLLDVTEDLVLQRDEFQTKALELKRAVFEGYRERLEPIRLGNGL